MPQPEPAAPLRIVSLDVHVLALRNPPLLNATNVHRTHAGRTLVRLETDAGVIGWGEASGDQRAPIAANRAWLLGADCADVTGLRSRFLAASGAALEAWAAVETALLDAAAKRAGLPLCDHLGGRVRDRVEWSAYLFYKAADEEGRGEAAREALTPEQVVEQAGALVAGHGFRQLKLKAGFFAPDLDVETFRLLRERFPLGEGYEIRIDPNANWSLATAIRVAGELEPWEPQYLEDLCGGIEQNAELKRHTDRPTASNMAISSFADLPENARLRGFDVVLGDHHRWGGILAFRELGARCREAGWGLSVHSTRSFGVSQAAALHACAATPELGFAADTHYPWTDPDGDVLVGGKLAFEAGHMRVPDAPGLGVEVDPEKVAEYAELYESGAVRKREELARSLDPEWPWKRPRW